MLSDFFCGKPLLNSIIPEEVVAHGAAIQAARLTGQDNKAELMVLMSVASSMSQGFDVVNGKW